MVTSRARRRILVVGGGGREHALVHKIRESPRLEALYCTPGNAGIAREADCFACSLAPPFAPLIAAIRERRIDLVVVGPEAPLADGIADALETEGIPVFGPVREAARLEASKTFSKEFMAAARIPTARFASFENSDEALKFARSLGAPVVVKADGLAAGKGVVVAHTLDEAEAAIRENLDSRKFGDASGRVIVEEFLDGQEASILALSDGHVIRTLASAQDHKRLLDRDSGPNTGGMGAYSPAPVVTPDLLAEINETVIGRAHEELQRRGIAYRGVLYAGIMLTSEGPSVLEFNCRFGDPEAQVILPRLTNDFVDIVEAVCNGTLHEHELTYVPDTCITVVMAARGYPENPEKGACIEGLDGVAARGKATVFHSGTALDGGEVVVAGGRVLSVTALASSLPRAIDKVYREVERIRFDGAQYRRDIGRKGLAAL